MTGLFDKITLVKKPEVVLVAGVKEVEGGLFPSQKSDAPSQSAPNFDDLGDGISFGGEVTPTQVIQDVLGDDKAFAVKGVTPFPPAFMAAQVQADYHEELFGKDNVTSVMLRNLCAWASRYNSSKRGERTKLALGALKQAREEELMIEKETKGLMNR